MTPELRELLQDFVAFSDRAVDGVEGLLDGDLGHVATQIEPLFEELRSAATVLRFRAEGVEHGPDPKGGLRAVR